MKNLNEFEKYSIIEDTSSVVGGTGAQAPIIVENEGLRSIIEESGGFFQSIIEDAEGF